jgi:hypothetical protein
VIVRRIVFAAAMLFAPTLYAQGAVVSDADRLAQQRIELVLRDFDRRGLPADLLRAKVAEGVAKGASPPRIAEAVVLLASRVDSVARALAPSVSPQELHAGAEALAVGVSAPTLRSLRLAMGRRSAEPYFLFVIRLVRRGVSQEQAIRAVRALIDRQTQPNTLLAIADDLARDVASGLSPDVALNDRMTRLVGGFGPASSVNTGDVSSPTGLTGTPVRKP